MKTTFAIRTASLAIAMSLAGVAHAQSTGDGTTTTKEQTKGGGGSAKTKDSQPSTTEGSTTSTTTESTTKNNTKESNTAQALRYGDIVAFDLNGNNLDPNYRDITAFYKDINAFWGTINPFYGDISAFWGNIDAFWGDIAAFNDPAYLESLGTFWQLNGAQISTIDDTWGLLVDTGASTGEFGWVRDNFDRLTAQAITKFGVKGFTQAEADAVFARHGIDLNNLSTLSGKTASERSAFFIDWHDTVMDYSGIDHVDHWMSAINWTPSVTQIQGEGTQSMVGIIDADFGATGDLANNLVWSGGSGTTLNGHGAGVASLIAAAHDGSGVMGIAPNTKIAAYNPFAYDGTATWDDVAIGIAAIKGYAWLDGTKASVINLSLGEPGWVAAQGLADVFKRWYVTPFRNSTTYVVAAGNSGISQTQNINWGYATDSTGKRESNAAVIFVGSVDPTGQISSFSNRPGSACLLDNGVCRAGNELKNFFIVAPGELILTSDGMGGVVRRSGTSFSAPLVSGAITLLHDRWPWLANNPHETAEIIFRSAKDLGAPGVDEVYGWGLLDVTASQSPLDFNKTSFTLYHKRGQNWKNYSISGADLIAGGIPSWWETDDVFFTMFEDIGNTYRDFAVPMSSFTYGKTTNALGNGYQRLQDFVSNRFATWINSGGTDKNGDGVAGIRQARSDNRNIQGGWTLRYDAVMPRYTEEGLIDPVHSAATLTNPNGKMSFTLGHGQGAMAINGTRFGFIGDHDKNTGGVNPVLGFASGEMFASASVEVAPKTTVAFGFSQNNETWDEVYGLTAQERQTRRAMGDNAAHAMTVDVKHRVSDNVTLGAEWTRLREDQALLGAQTSFDSLLGQGSATEAVTVSAAIEFGDGLSFDLSATGARTKTADGQALVTDGAAKSTAAQATVSKRGVFGNRDILRVSLAQPLNVEDGALELRSLAVVDRQTGETGIVSQRIGIETKRRIMGEAIYATPINRSAEFGLYGRYVSAGGQGEAEAVMVGANLGWRF